MAEQLFETKTSPETFAGGEEPALAETFVQRPSDHSQVTVEAVTDYDSFLRLEPLWNRLVLEAKIDHPFLSHEWVRTWWECFGAGKKLHILLVKAGDEAIAIAPLMLTDGRMYGLRVRRLEAIANDHTPRFDFIVACSQDQAYRAIWNYLLDQGRLWDVLQLRELVDGSRTLAELRRLAERNGYLTGAWRSVDSPYLQFIGSWDNYFKKLSHNLRSKLRKGLNGLSRLGGAVKLEVITSEDRLESHMEEMMRIEAVPWKVQAGTAIRLRPELRLFYTTLARRAAGRGWLQLIFLTSNGSKIAAAYGLRYRNRLYVLKTGYDPQYYRYSPYNLLCYHVFRGAFEQGLAEYEFLGGNETWKLAWAKEIKGHTWLFVFPDRLRTRFLHFAKFRLVPRLKRLPFYSALHDTLLGEA